MNTTLTSTSTPSGHHMVCLILGLELNQPFSILAPHTGVLTLQNFLLRSDSEAKAYFLHPSKTPLGIVVVSKNFHSSVATWARKKKGESQNSSRNGKASKGK